jgi:hypothetical protein
LPKKWKKIWRIYRCQLLEMCYNGVVEIAGVDKKIEYIDIITKVEGSV